MVLGLLLYAGMGLLAVLIAWFRDSPLFEQPAGIAPIAGALPSLVLGLLVAALTVASTRFLTQRTSWARQLPARSLRCQAPLWLMCRLWLSIPSFSMKSAVFVLP